MKEIKTFINNKNCLVKNSEKGDPVNPCVDIYI